MPDEFLNVDDVADLFEVHPETIRRQARTGKLPYHRIGGQYRFVLAEILAATENAVTVVRAPAGPAPDFDALKVDA